MPNRLSVINYDYTVFSLMLHISILKYSVVNAQYSRVLRLTNPAHNSLFPPTHSLIIFVQTCLQCFLTNLESTSQNILA